MLLVSLRLKPPLLLLIMHEVEKWKLLKRRRGVGGLRALVVFVCVQILLSLSSSLSLDGEALLEFKKSFSGGPHGALSDWNENDRDPCSWSGVACDGLQRVVALDIRGKVGYRGGHFSFAMLQSSSRKGILHSVLNAGASQISETCMGILPRSDSAFGLDDVRSSIVGSSAVYRLGSTKLAGKLSPFIGNLTGLQVLSLPYNAFHGEIPKEIGKLRFLEVLELQGNSFSGHVPLELGELGSLRVLDLSYNSLNESIPKELGRCTKLEKLDLAGNRLNGSVPLDLGGLPRLQVLSLSLNQLSGKIDPELLSSCQSLEYFHLSSNFFTGEIPSELGNCSRLRSIALFSNFLEGGIPPELGRLSMLKTLDVSRNVLSHEIPEELADCKQLSVLVLTTLLEDDPLGNCTDVDPSSGLSACDKGEYNYFEGGIPANLVRLPQIQIIWAPRTTLNGPLPEYWGDCSSLQILNLGQNSFTDQIPAALGRCKNLFFLDLSNNKLAGVIPELPISCMLFFNVSGNSLSGNISTSLNFDCPKVPLFQTDGLLDTSQGEASPALLYSLLFYCSSWASNKFASILSEGLMVFHDLSSNNLTGLLPPPLIGEKLMEEHLSYGLFLNNNQLVGNISSTLLSSCERFQGLALSLSANQISGEIPGHLLGNCKTMKHFEASYNQIRGSIPPMLENLIDLEYLDMSENYLQGSIPSQLGLLKDLKYLILAGNKLTGAIPGELGEMTSLVVLDLSSNAFTDKIPEHLLNLRQLKSLYLQENRLSGPIPEGFANLTSLTIFNVSFNNLSGEIPKMGKPVTCESFRGNHFLAPCQSALSPSKQPEQMPGPLPYGSSPAVTTSGKRHRRFNSLEVAAFTSASAISFVVAILAVLFLYTRRYRSVPRGPRSGRKEVVTFTNIGVQLSYENVVRATGNFNVGNLIGNGGFGATYKAELKPGTLVAVKRLSVGKFQGIQQFDTEIRTLGRIRHPNLVTLIGYYASEREMFLIYNYLPGGNLESFIHETSTKNVDWCIIHKIALDIAKALAYLHDECVPRVVHRDIKPSNILLDNDLTAYLSDFGLARLLGVSETHATTDVAGTFGYLAPEYAMTCRVSEKADVYSYGVVLLELLSGKKALDPSFSSYCNGFNIVAWADMLFRGGRAHELFTTGLWDAGPHDDLVEALRLAVMCTVDTVSIRPLMRQVVAKLRQIQPPLLS